MKKSLIIYVLCFLFLTGCGEKTLTCTKVSNDYEMNLEDQIKIKFDKEYEKIVKMSFSAEYEFSEFSDLDESYKDDFEKMVYEQYRSVEDVGGKIKTYVKDKKFKVSLKYDATQLTDEQKIDLLKSNLYYSTNYEQTKTHLEDNGYICE